MIEAAVLLAVLAPAAAGVAAWFAPASWGWRAVAAGVVAGAAGIVGVGWLVFADGPARAFDGVVVVDALGAWVLLTVAIVALLALAASPAWLRHGETSGTLRGSDAGHYLALLAWFVASLAAVPLLDNLGLLWVAIEAGTAVAALLVGFDRTPAAIEAAWKYLVLGSVGVGFALLATLLAYASSVPVLGERSDALDWTRLMAVAPALDPGLLRLAFIFALVGYGTKVGLAPFHTWLPDAHSLAPSPISALLSGVSLNVALYALIRFHLVAVGALGPGFSSGLLVTFGLFSLAVALPFIVAQGDLKRLLAYSSIEHMGLLALAVGLGGRVALLAATLHLLGHALTKSTLFIAAGRVVERHGTRRLGRLGGVMEATPVAGAALVVAILLIGGLPPSGVFAAEFGILVGGAGTSAVLPVAAAALLLALAFAGMLFHAVRLAWGGEGRRARVHDPDLQGDGPGRISARRPSAASAEALLLGLPLAAVVGLGLWTPAPLRAILDQVVAVLGAGRG